MYFFNLEKFTGPGNEFDISSITRHGTVPENILIFQVGIMMMIAPNSCARKGGKESVAVMGEYGGI